MLPLAVLELSRPRDLPRTVTSWRLPAAYLECYSLLFIFGTQVPLAEGM